VYDYAVSELLADPAVRYLTTGRDYVDALVSGPAVASTNGTLLLTADGDAVPAAASARLSAATELLTRVVIVGTEADFPAALVDTVTAAITEPVVEAAFCLTLLHNNDGESQLLPIEPPFGGVAAFAATVERERALAAEVPGCASAGEILVSSGDNFLPGPTARINRELRVPNGLPWYDAVALDLIGYDAYTLGNHDFDFGPEGLREFYDSFALPQRLISANVDVSADPLLGPIASDAVAGPDDEGIFPSAVVEPVPGTRVGIIGLTTTSLPTVSSPGPTVTVSGNVPGSNDADVTALAAIVADEVADVRAQGADIIILSSHLQSIELERAVLAELSGIDAIIAGGGDEVLTNPGVPLQPGENAALGTYPLLEADADGTLVPIVTTPGNFNYVGRLALRFDAEGQLLPETGVNTFRSRLVRVSDTSAPGGVTPSPQIIAEVDEPLQASIDEFFGEVLADQQVPLDGRRETSRSEETNLGNLLTDSYVWASGASRAAGAPGWEDVPADRPIVAITNGGGIRNESILPVGDFTRLTTVQVAAFDNLVRAHTAVTGAQLTQLIDFALVENWSHVAGFTVTIDQAAPAGERVIDLVLDDGTEIVADGALVGGEEMVVFTTIDFLLRGGSDFPFEDVGLPFDDSVEVIVDGEGDLLYSRVLEEFVVADNGLAGVISAADYPEGGEGRITKR
jgi:5'-nucleotidase / UDP-sugar diphosphatase